MLYQINCVTMNFDLPNDNLIRIKFLIFNFYIFRSTLKFHSAPVDSKSYYCKRILYCRTRPSRLMAFLWGDLTKG